MRRIVPPQETVNSLLYDTNTAELVAVFPNRHLRFTGLHDVKMETCDYGFASREILLFLSPNNRWFAVQRERKWFGRRSRGNFTPLDDRNVRRLLDREEKFSLLEQFFPDDDTPPA